MWPASIVKKRILSVLHQIENVFRKEPGQMDLAKHGIDTGSLGCKQCSFYRVNVNVLIDVWREVEC